VRLSRNKKDARSKGYAFIEFKYPEVAVIAAEAMNGYFLFKQKLVSRVLKQSEVHPALFKGANKKMKSIPWAKLEADRHNKPRTPEEHAKRMARLLRKDERRREQIAKAGIEYEYESLQAQVPSQPKKITFK
jgi:nucleolar protein 15